MSIAVVGTGTMGSRVVALLVQAGHRVVSYDPSPSAQESARVAGAEPKSSATEVAKEAEIILLSLPKPAHVRITVTGENGILVGIQHGQIVVDTSTVDPGTSEEMAILVRERGGEYLDAPILGRPDGIGNWVMPVGGITESFVRVKPILEIVAKRVVHMGPVGSGNKLKLVNQLMFASVNMVYCEIFALAQKSGIGAAAFNDVLAASGASTVSGLFKEIGRRVVEDDFTPDFSVDLLAKDLSLASSFVSSFDGTTSITGLSLPLARMAQGAGLGNNDNAALYRLFLEHFQGE
jgi:3-hydroxyisobutyrate dehydrogenase-like beta-hydroxyacid dehydrogenase